MRRLWSPRRVGGEESGATRGEESAQRQPPAGQKSDREPRERVGSRDGPRSPRQACSRSRLAPAQFLPRAVARRTPPARCVSFFDGDEAEEEAYLAGSRSSCCATGRRRGAAASSRRRHPHQRRGGPPTSRRRRRAQSRAASSRASRRPAGCSAATAPRLRGGRVAPRRKVASVPGGEPRVPGLPEQAGPAAAARRPRARLRLLPRGRSTIFGAAGLWSDDRLPLAVTEAITPSTTRGARAPPQTLKLLNAMKIGWYFGIVLDALKLAG